MKNYKYQWLEIERKGITTNFTLIAKEINKMWAIMVEKNITDGASEWQSEMKRRCNEKTKVIRRILKIKLQRTELNKRAFSKGILI